MDQKSATQVLLERTKFLVKSVEEIKHEQNKMKDDLIDIKLTNSKVNCADNTGRIGNMEKLLIGLDCKSNTKRIGRIEKVIIGVVVIIVFSFFSNVFGPTKDKLGKPKTKVDYRVERVAPSTDMEKSFLKEIKESWERERNRE